MEKTLSGRAQAGRSRAHPSQENSGPGALSPSLGGPPRAAVSGMLRGFCCTGAGGWVDSPDPDGDPERCCGCSPPGPGVGLGGSLSGPRDLEPVTTEQRRLRKLKRSPASSAGTGLSEGLRRGRDLAVGRRVGRSEHLSELQRTQSRGEKQQGPSKAHGLYATTSTQRRRLRRSATRRSDVTERRNTPAATSSGPATCPVPAPDADGQSGQQGSACLNTGQNLRSLQDFV